MTAELLVTAILDEGEDPKEFLRNLPPRHTPLPTIDQVEIDLDVDWEPNVAPEDNFENPEDIAFVRQQIEADNVWGWCQVHVRAMWTDPQTGKTYEGYDSLGGCSYRSEEDFKQPGGYYDDMKKVAYDNLIKEIEYDR